MRPRIQFSALLMVLAAIATGCREPVREPRDGGREVPDCDEMPSHDSCDEASRDNAMFTWGKAMCSLLFDCCSETDRRRTAELMFGAENAALLQLQEPAMFDDPLICRRATALALFTRFQKQFEALDDNRRTFDREAARDCISWFQRGAAACAPGLVLLDEDHEPQSCKHMFPAAKQATESCYEDDDCVQAPDGGASTCETRTRRNSDGGIDFALDGVCRPLPAIGAKCPLPNSNCGKNAYCALDEVCRVRPSVDELCIAAPCDDTSFCDANRQPPTCTLRKTNFETCTVDFQCGKRMSCDADLHLCLETPDVSPLDIQFRFCLGTEGTPVARSLSFVPRDGGL